MRRAAVLMTLAVLLVPGYARADHEQTAICRDGTPSYSHNRAGTCSSHGGVAQFLGSLATQDASPVAVPAATSQPVGQACDPNYSGICIPRTGSDIDCPQVSGRDFRVVGTDIHGFDRDNDGLACESGAESATTGVATVPALTTTPVGGVAQPVGQTFTSNVGSSRSAASTADSPAPRAVGRPAVTGAPVREPLILGLGALLIGWVLVAGGMTLRRA